MAQIGMIGSKVRGTPLVASTANQGGNVVVLAQQGYPVGNTTVPAHKRRIEIVPDDLYL